MRRSRRLQRRGNLRLRVDEDWFFRSPVDMPAVCLLGTSTGVRCSLIPIRAYSELEIALHDPAISLLCGLQEGKRSTTHVIRWPQGVRVRYDGSKSDK